MANGKLTQTIMTINKIGHTGRRLLHEQGDNNNDHPLATEWHWLGRRVRRQVLKFLRKACEQISTDSTRKTERPMIKWRKIMVASEWI